MEDNDIKTPLKQKNKNVLAHASSGREKSTKVGCEAGVAPFETPGTGFVAVSDSAGNGNTAAESSKIVQAHPSLFFAGDRSVSARAEASVLLQTDDASGSPYPPAHPQPILASFRPILSPAGNQVFKVHAVDDVPLQTDPSRASSALAGSRAISASKASTERPALFLTGQQEEATLLAADHFVPPAASTGSRGVSGEKATTASNQQVFRGPRIGYDPMEVDNAHQSNSKRSECSGPKRKRYEPGLKEHVLKYMKTSQGDKLEEISKKFGVREGSLWDWRRRHLEKDEKTEENESADDSKKNKVWKRKRYSTSLKVEVLQFLKAQRGSVNLEEVAHRFHVKVNTLRDWHRNEEEILNSSQATEEVESVGQNEPSMVGPKKKNAFTAGDQRESKKISSTSQTTEKFNSKKKSRASQTTVIAGGNVEAKEPATPVNVDEKKTFKRKRYLTQHKVEVLEFVNAHKGCVNYEEVCRRFGVSASALRDWRKHEEEILRSAVLEKRGDMKSNPKYALKQLADDVMLYYEHNSDLPPEEQDADISISAVQNRAHIIKEQLIEQHMREPFLEKKVYEAIKVFKVSTTWAARILKRIKQDVCTVEQIQNLVAQYAPENVYCMDYACLFFMAMPSKNHAEEWYIKGMCKRKDMSTLYVCTNENASVKILPTLIRDTNNPDCLKVPGRKVLPFIYQRQGVSDAATLETWWEEVFLPQIRQHTAKPTLLVLSRASSRLVDPKGQVRAAILPKECMRSHQPMAHGIVRALKKNYRFFLLREILTTFHDRATRRKIAASSCLPEGLRGIAEGYPPHLADVMQLLSNAWESISAECILHSWSKTELRSDTDPLKDEKKVDASPKKVQAGSDVLLREILEELIAVAGSREIEDRSSVESPDAEFERDVLGVIEVATDGKGRIRCDFGSVLDSWFDLEETNAVDEYLKDKNRASLNGNVEGALTRRGLEPGVTVPNADAEQYGNWSKNTVDNQEEPEVDQHDGPTALNSDGNQQDAKAGHRDGSPEIQMGTNDIENCAIEIMALATRLLKAQPELHAVASDLMKLPDKLLRSQRKAAPVDIPPNTA